MSWKTNRRREHFFTPTEQTSKLRYLTELYDVGTPDPKYVEVQLENLRRQHGRLINPFTDFVFSNSSQRALTNDEENLLTLLVNQLSNTELAQIKRIRIIKPSSEPRFGLGLPSDVEDENTLGTEEYRPHVLQIRIRDIRPGLTWYHETGHALYNSLEKKDEYGGQSVSDQFDYRWQLIPRHERLWKNLPGNLPHHRHLNAPNEAFAELKATYILGSPYTRATGSIREMLGDENAEWFDQLMKKIGIEGTIDN